MNVLYIEDSLTDREAVRRSLGDTYSLTCADTLAEGLGWLRVDGFDSAILDLSLPDADGVDVVESVRRVAPRLPIVVMTGYGEGPELNALRAGANEYLVKDNLTKQSLHRALCRASERMTIKMHEQCPLYADCVKQALVTPGGCPLYDPVMRRLDKADEKLDQLESMIAAVKP